MTTSNDISARAQAALERVADRLPELPKPVLAAVGAADLAGRQLFDFVNKLSDKAGVKAPTIPDRDEVVDELRAAASDLPGKVQALAAEMPDKVQELVAELPDKAKELADQLEQFATSLPGRVQKFTDELPGKVSEVGEQLQPDQIKNTAEAYGQLLGTVFSTLAERGEKTWDDLRNNGPKAGTVVDSESEKVAAKTTKTAAEAADKTADKAAEKTADKSAAKTADKAADKTADKTATTDAPKADTAARTPRPARRKPAAAKPADTTPTATRTAAAKTAQAAERSAAGKSATKSADKPAQA